VAPDPIDRIAIAFEQLERALDQLPPWPHPEPPPPPAWYDPAYVLPEGLARLGHQVEQRMVRRDLTRRIFAVGEKVRRGQPFDQTELDLLNLAGWIDDLPGWATTRAQFIGAHQ
jgi:hypothetical protein